MLVSLWTLKGGAGCSVTSALLGLHLARQRQATGAVLVDLGGDLPAILGCPEPSAGLVDWLRAGPTGPPNGLARMAVDLTPGLRLVGRGQGPMPEGEPHELLIRQLDAFPGQVVVDAGLVMGSGGQAALARWFAAHATRSVLVTRACYLALSRAARSPVVPSGVVVVREPGRAFADDDIADAIGAPIVGDVAADPAVARAVDAGLLLSRVPGRTHRALGAVA